MTVILKLIVEEHDDGFVAYPLGLKGVVVADGDNYDEALANIKSAIAFHLETFRACTIDGGDKVLSVFVDETAIAV